MENADAAHELLMRMVGPKLGPREKISELWLPNTEIKAPKASKNALFAYNPGPKSRASAQVKAFVRYGPGEGANRFRHLLDLARLCLVYSDCASLRMGLEQVQEEFEVVDIRNHYVPSAVTLLGERYIEVLVIVKEGLPTPHVCELRLEEEVFFKARIRCAQDLNLVCQGFATMYAHRGVHPGSVEYLARKVLRSPADSHGVRLLRRHLERVYGSSIVAWRRAFGGSPLVAFMKFREACQQLSTTSYQARTVEYWQALDAGRSGCISLFELDPEGVVLLAKLRERMLALMPSENSIDVDQLFQVLSENTGTTKTVGQLETLEFRKCVRALGFSRVDADRMFSYLDLQGGNQGLSAMKVSRGAAAITPKDILWLLKMPSLVHIDSVMLISADSSQELAKCRERWARIIEVEEERQQRMRVRQLGRRDPARQRPIGSPSNSPFNSPPMSPRDTPPGSPRDSPANSPPQSPRSRARMQPAIPPSSPPRSPRSSASEAALMNARIPPSERDPQAQNLAEASRPPPRASNRPPPEQRPARPTVILERAVEREEDSLMDMEQSLIDERSAATACLVVKEQMSVSMPPPQQPAAPAPSAAVAEDAIPVVKSRSALKSDENDEEEAEAKAKVQTQRSRTISFSQAEVRTFEKPEESPNVAAPPAFENTLSQGQEKSETDDDDDDDEDEDSDEESSEEESSEDESDEDSVAAANSEKGPKKAEEVWSDPSAPGPQALPHMQGGAPAPPPQNSGNDEEEEEDSDEETF